MAKWLIVWIVWLIILENRKWFWITCLNSNTFHFEIFVRFENMQKLFKFKKYAEVIQFQKIWSIARKKNTTSPGSWNQRLTSARKKHTADPTAHKRSKETHDPCASSWLGILFVLDYLFKFQHFSFSNFYQIKKILVNAFLIENGKMVNSLNS